MSIDARVTVSRCVNCGWEDTDWLPGPVECPRCGHAVAYRRLAPADETITRLSHRTIERFLALPVEAFPAAHWANERDDDMGDPWLYLRDSTMPETERRLNHLPDATIYLRADRDGWRGGALVVTGKGGAE